MDEELRHFFINTKLAADKVIVQVGGECDAASLTELEDALSTAESGEPDEVIVDLAEVTFIDSMTLGTLTAAAKRIRLRGGLLRVVGAVAPEVKRAFEVTGLHAYLIETS